MGRPPMVPANIVAGLRGPAGADGAGAPGPPGPQGPVTWDSGATAPDIGSGSDGDWYLRTSNGQVLRKEAGVWVSKGNIQGPAGADGADGTDGQTVLSGSGVPAGGTGTDGDFYVRTSNWNIYGPKAAGAWGSPTSLVGATGADGSDGAAATIAPGTVDTVPNGDPATVTNSGTSSAAVFDFEIPNGEKGFKGDSGPPGPLGNTISTVVSGGVYALNPAFATDYTLTLTGNISLTASGMSNAASMTVALLQDGVGARTVTLPSSWIGEDQVAISDEANKLDILVIWKSPLGTHVNRVWSGDLPAGFWSPNALADRVAWYSANALPGEDGDILTAWDNLWAASDLAASGAPILHILNGQKYVSFDGVDDHMDATHSPTVPQPFTYAFVAKVPANGPVISGSVNTAFDITSTGGNWTGNAGADMTGSANTHIWQTIVMEVFSGSNDIIRVDGTETGGANMLASKNGTYVRLFANDDGTHNAGSIAELIKVSATLDAPTLANLETYLNIIRDDLNGA